MTAAELALGLAVFGAALLYASVGHGGASAYLAVMAMFSFSPETMRPTALTLNLVVAGIATVQFWRAGHFSARLFWPFALSSIPLAFVGGTLGVPLGMYRALLGAVLLSAAARFAIVDLLARGTAEIRGLSAPVAAGVGAGIGLLSGLTGVGGGIFLSPVLMWMRWADAKRTAAVSAPFVFVNSAAGLAGQAPTLAAVPGAAWWWVLAAVAGGTLGATLGSRRFDHPMLRRVLAAVLAVAGAKLLL